MERPSLDDVRRLLSSLHSGAPIEVLEPLTGGFWSSAYGYRVGDDELVLRLGEFRDGFEADRAAMAYASPDLPVPEVLEIGSAFGASYCVSRRFHGRFLEDVTVDEVERAAPMLERLLRALRDAPCPEASGWHDWLRSGLVDDPRAATAGWSGKLAAHPHAHDVFVRAAARLDELLPAMPQRSDVVHGDLLHRNVLVSPDASRVNAVFSWKCSVIGDFLFDVAWCTFWGATFHPGIAAVDAFGRMTADGAAGDDAALRHHCYELHIGTTHLGWYAWTGDTAGLERLAGHVETLLDR
ncbi:MAG TPA: aminoglycoside phosphotransferase family protein [Acidimicrobiales bacterium]|nr:aminoglycoside phosphotransferase family protein [Acidimicrobiales bacterium]